MSASRSVVQVVRMSRRLTALDFHSHGMPRNDCLISDYVGDYSPQAVPGLLIEK